MAIVFYCTFTLFCIQMYTLYWHTCLPSFGAVAAVASLLKRPGVLVFSACLGPAVVADERASTERKMLPAHLRPIRSRKLLLAIVSSWPAARSR